MHCNRKKLLVISLAICSSTICFAQNVAAQQTKTSLRREIALLKQQTLTLQREVAGVQASVVADVIQVDSCGAPANPNCHPSRGHPFAAHVNFPQPFTRPPEVVVVPYRARRFWQHHNRVWILTVTNVTATGFDLIARSYGDYKPDRGWDLPLDVQYIAYEGKTYNPYAPKPGGATWSAAP